VHSVEFKDEMLTSKSSKILFILIFNELFSDYLVVCDEA
jgi:hypothetical protein